MTTRIINLADYREGTQPRRNGENSFAPSPDRLWEFLVYNIKIDPEQYAASCADERTA